MIILQILIIIIIIITKTEIPLHLLSLKKHLAIKTTTYWHQKNYFIPITVKLRDQTTSG